MKGNVVSFRDYKRSKRFGQLTMFQYVWLIFSILFTYSLGIGFFIILSTAQVKERELIIALALVMLLVALIGVHHLKKLYIIFKQKDFYAHYDYLEFYLFNMAFIMSLVAFFTFLSGKWICLAFLSFAIPSIYVIYKIEKLNREKKKIS